MRLSRAFVLVFAFGSLVTFSGCKQGLGQRCEQGSDCASGYCGYTAGGDEMPSAQAHMCTEAIPTTKISPPSTGQDGGDAAAPDAQDDGASVDGSDADAPSEAGSGG